MTKLVHCALLVLVFVLIAMATAKAPVFSSSEDHAHYSRQMFQHIKDARVGGAIGEGLLEEGSNGQAVADFSTLLSVSSLQCLRNNGYVAAIPRAYQSNGRIDGNFVQNNKNSIAAGFEYNDCYLFPCPTCAKSPEDQFNELWAVFSNYSVKVGMVWIDIEGTEYWKDLQYNINFMTRLLNRAQSIGAAIGIYASKYQWTSIFGSWNSPHDYPLWYAGYNGDPSCRSFTPFGGFQTAQLHQFQGTTSQCGAEIDLSSYC